MKTYIAALPLLLVSLFTIAQEKIESTKWEWLGANESGAWLQTERSGSTVNFSLELNRGSPSYNSGLASGEFTMDKHLGVYQTSEFPKCTLIFAFVGDLVEIKQLGSDSDCGFGFGVMADHILTLKK